MQDQRYGQHPAPLGTMCDSIGIEQVLEQPLLHPPTPYDASPAPGAFVGKAILPSPFAGCQDLCVSKLSGESSVGMDPHLHPWTPSRLQAFRQQTPVDAKRGLDSADGHAKSEPRLLGGIRTR